MRKRDELTNPGSFLARARDDEMLFVLLGRDAAAPAAIRAWAAERIRLGANRTDDAQLVEAFACARIMEAERAAAGLKPCPFCGGQAEILQRGDRLQPCTVACTGCGCFLESGDAGEHSGDAWNRRAAVAGDGGEGGGP